MGPGDPETSEGEISPMRESSGIQRSFLEEAIPRGTQGMNNNPRGEAQELTVCFWQRVRRGKQSAVSHDPSRELKVKCG